MVMIKCPKCGFAQPQDEYCANCGINITNFKPIKTPIFFRVIRSPIFHITLFAVVAASGFFAIRRYNQDSFAERIASIEQARNAETLERSLLEKSEFDSHARARDEGGAKLAAHDDLTISADANKPSPSATAAGALKLEASAADQAGGATRSQGLLAAKVGQLEARASAPVSAATVTFFEANRRAIEAVFSRALNAGVTADGVEFAVVEGAADLLKRATASKQLVEVDRAQVPIQTNRVARVFKGAGTQVENIVGFTVELTVGLGEDGFFPMHVRAVRAIRDRNLNPEIALPETFLLPASGALLISGVLPHSASPPSPAEERIYKGIPVLRMMTTDSFKALLTDALIAIELK